MVGLKLSFFVTAGKCMQVYNRIMVGLKLEVELNNTGDPVGL